jgi:hypothetical protein
MARLKKNYQANVSRDYAPLYCICIGGRCDLVQNGLGVDLSKLSKDKIPLLEGTEPNVVFLTDIPKQVPNLMFVKVVVFYTSRSPEDLVKFCRENLNGIFVDSARLSTEPELVATEIREYLEQK